MTDDILTVKEESSNCETKVKGKINPDRRLNNHLKFSTVQNIIYKFLNCNRIETVEIKCVKYTKEELAERIGITIKELEAAKAPYFYTSIASKISLPLISLYCSAKWADGE